MSETKMHNDPTPEMQPLEEEVVLSEAVTSPGKLVWRRFCKNKGAIIGGVILVLLILSAIFAPLITVYDPIAVAPKEAMQPPSAAHPLGTDVVGRDILTRIIYGARVSLQLGLVAVSISAVIGVSIGLIAGYFGGKVDNLLMRFVDMVMAFPQILLALIIVFALGKGIINVMIAVGVSNIPSYARVTRGSVLSAKELPYVEAARSGGLKGWQIMIRHILPNVVSPVIVMATIGAASAILSGSSLSFLGMGAQPPEPEWGAMLSEGRGYISTAWWISLFPGIAIMLTVLSVNLLGDGLRDALDPRLK